MRLGQLSRKISVRTDEIVAFLKKQGVVVEDSFNARVEDEYVQFAISHFAPHLKTEPTVSAGREEKVVGDSSVMTDVAEPTESAAQPLAFGDLETSASQDDEVALRNEVPDAADTETINEINGVIKAQKIELQGLKVLGKIELPEPKKKDPGTDPAEAEPVGAPVEQPDPRRRKNSQRPRRSQDRPRKNPVALEREQRAREQEEQRERMAEQEKQRKTQHYHKRVKPKGPTKAVRIHDEEFTPVEDVQAPPNSLWGRFVKWLTSY